jgi:hypothetical protein
MMFIAGFMLRAAILFVCIMVSISTASAKSAAEMLYAELAKLTPDQR